MVDFTNFLHVIAAICKISCCIPKNKKYNKKINFNKIYKNLERKKSTKLKLKLCKNSFCSNQNCKYSHSFVEQLKSVKEFEIHKEHTINRIIYTEAFKLTFL